MGIILGVGSEQLQENVYRQRIAGAVQTGSPAEQDKE